MSLKLSICFLGLLLSVSAGCGRSLSDQVMGPSTSTEVSLPLVTSESGSVSTQVAATSPPGTFEPPTVGVKVTSANTVSLPVAEVETSADLPATTELPPSTTVSASVPTSPQTAKSSSSSQTYIVEQGDTMSVIANEKFGILLSELLAANNITDKDSIRPGQELIIPN